MATVHPTVKKAFVVGSAGLIDELGEWTVSYVNASRGAGVNLVPALAPIRPDHFALRCSTSFLLLRRAELVGVSCVGGQDPALMSRVFASEAEFGREEPDPQVGAVVCGWDLSFNFAKLALASLYLQKNSGCVLVASNRDAFDRLSDRNMPGQ